MRNAIAAAVLLVSTAAVCEERWIPLDSPATIRITNPTSERLALTLHRASTPQRNRHEEARRFESVDVEAGATLQRTLREVPAGVVRIDADPRLQIRAVATTPSATVSLPVLSADDALESATVEQRPPWQTGVVIVNPGGEHVLISVDDRRSAIAPHETLTVERATRIDASSPVLLFVRHENESTGARLYTRVTAAATLGKRRAVRSITPAPVSQTVVLTPSRDNTLYETSNGGSSNGAGPHLFAGATQSRSRRRALIRFDVAGQVPPGSRITRVTLTMRVSQTITGPEQVSIFRVAADWGEGTSNAGTSRDGDGSATTPGDATWLHTFFPDRRWASQGGDFDAAADATAGAGIGSVTWESTSMTARVQQWLDTPATNFGWIAIGAEARSGTAKRFDSREVVPETSRPSLTIELEQ